MSKQRFIVPRDLSREESGEWLVAAITAAREAAGHGGEPGADAEDIAPDGADRDGTET